MRSSEQKSRSDQGDLCGELHRYRERKPKPGSCTSADIDTSTYISVESGTVYKGKKQSKIAAGISAREEEILGTTHVGKRIFFGNNRLYQ